MDYRAEALPSAKSERNWLCETYGAEFRMAFHAWCDEIVKFAPSSPAKLHIVPLDEILDQKHSDWGHVWRKIKDQSVFDRLKSLIAYLKNRQPPFRLLATQARFHVQSTFYLYVIAIVEIDDVNSKVIFDYFHWYGDGSY